MPFDFTKLNVWAVLVAALAAFFIGGAWYSVLFGKLWVRLHGYSPDKIKHMQAAIPPPFFFGGMLVSYLVLAFALAIFVSALPETSAVVGIAIGVVFWLGASAIAMTGQIVSDRSFGIYLIDVGCNLVYLVLMGAILGAWR